MLTTAKEAITLLNHLLQVLEGASKTTVKNRIAHGNVTVNGRKSTNPGFMLRPGDAVEYERQAPVVYRHKPPFPIIFEDEAILIAEKPAGLLTIGDKGTGGTSFYQQLSGWIRDRSDGRERIFVVHRIDREVSGLLVLAKSEDVRDHLKKGWAAARKLYYALVEGEPPAEKGVFKSWLAEGRDQKVFSVREREGAKFAVTHYRVIERIPGHTLLEIELETGRKNQIRVHLSEAGCPVTGDRRYGAAARFERRIRLHAFFLSLIHPLTGERVEFKSRMPRGFMVLKEENEKYK